LSPGYSPRREAALTEKDGTPELLVSVSELEVARDRGGRGNDGNDGNDR